MKKRNTNIADLIPVLAAEINAADGYKVNITKFQEYHNLGRDTMFKYMRRSEMFKRVDCGVFQYVGTDTSTKKIAEHISAVRHTYLKTLRKQSKDTTPKPGAVNKLPKCDEWSPGEKSVIIKLLEHTDKRYSEILGRLSRIESNQSSICQAWDIDPVVSQKLNGVHS